MKDNFGFVRVAAAVPMMRVADCSYNVEQVKQQITEAIEEGVEIICFPELTWTGYTCGDLFFTQRLQQNTLKGLEDVCDFTREKPIFHMRRFQTSHRGVKNAACGVGHPRLRGLKRRLRGVKMPTSVTSR